MLTEGIGEPAGIIPDGTGAKVPQSLAQRGVFNTSPRVPGTGGVLIRTCVPRFTTREASIGVATFVARTTSTEPTHLGADMGKLVIVSSTLSPDELKLICKVERTVAGVREVWGDGVHRGAYLVTFNGLFSKFSISPTMVPVDSIP